MNLTWSIPKYTGEFHRMQWIFRPDPQVRKREPELKSMLFELGNRDLPGTKSRLVKREEEMEKEMRGICRGTERKLYGQMFLKPPPTLSPLSRSLFLFCFGYASILLRFYTTQPVTLGFFSFRQGPIRRRVSVESDGVKADRVRHCCWSNLGTAQWDVHIAWKIRGQTRQVTSAGDMVSRFLPRLTPLLPFYNSIPFVPSFILLQTSQPSKLSSLSGMRESKVGGWVTAGHFNSGFVLLIWVSCIFRLGIGRITFYFP